MHPVFDPDAFVVELAENMLAVARTNAQRSKYTTSHHLDFQHDGSSYQYAYPRIDFEQPPDRVVESSDLRSQLGDVELSVERYALQDEMLRENGLPTPVVRMNDDYVPVDLGIANMGYAPAHSVEGIVGAFNEAPSTLRTDLVNSTSAEKGFKRGLNRFLSTRLFPAKPPPQRQSTLVGGYQFTVTTRTPGLRIHYSPAYFINQRRVFGLPSTPVSARLQPGRYIFGAYLPSPGYWSSDEYDVPGTTHTAHLDI